MEGEVFHATPGEITLTQIILSLAAILTKEDDEDENQK